MILNLPLRIPTSKKKDFILNLNNYRNAHFLVLNKAKIEYSKAVVSQLPAGNQLLARIAKADAEVVRQLRSMKKKHEKEPEMYQHLSHAVKSQAERIKRPMVERVKTLKRIQIVEPVYLNFRYFHGNNTNIDVSNPCSVIDKFTCDALTAAGIWVDDNIKIVRKASYEWGGVDRENPRCELRILLAPATTLV